jgi:formate dehydrogenase beta subunit
MSRAQKPIYLDRLPPCNAQCPAGENIQAWLAHARAGRFHEAWQTIMRDNPLPGVHGRVCYHTCEDACNRGKYDQPVSIHAVERFLGDMAVTEKWAVEMAPSTGKRVLVVGGGPSGISAAYHLARRGHFVEIREAGPVAGGMLHFGIPQYRLPRDVLRAEIQRIENMGVVFTLNHKVEDVLAEKSAGKFDAVFIAVGAHLSKRINLPSRDAGKIYDALGFLKQVESGEAPQIGRQVAIYGGGNTAMDAARTARRLGAEETLIIYRRNRDRAPALDFEIEEALEEGIEIHWLRTIKKIEESTITIERMELDEEGWPQPTGQFDTLAADSLILALGQDTDTDFLRAIPGLSFQKDGTVDVDARMMTGHAGIFAGGDMVPSERSVTVAVGHGKKAARFIHSYLSGQAIERSDKHELASPDKLHTWFYVETDMRKQGELHGPQRVESFDEILHGLSESEATYEAGRCFSCGNCFECDGCWIVCPEEAITKLGPGKRYRYNYEFCTGCAVCSEQCPCGAIKMLPR